MSNVVRLQDTAIDNGVEGARQQEGADERGKETQQYKPV
jgi:hypothetical protein